MSKNSLPAVLEDKSVVSATSAFLALLLIAVTIYVRKR